MSSNTKMLIDATHPEETRVVVQRNGRVEEFDFESAARKLLRGNIYLAKVTRVEPSLQAAFVDYGGNRHGFLAFNEIHPDYYQIPVADRQALIDEEAAAEAELEAAADRRAEALARRAAGGRPSYDAAPRGAADSDSDNEDAGSALARDDAPDSSHIIDVEDDDVIEEVGGDAPQSIAASLEMAADTISEAAPDDHDDDDDDNDEDDAGGGDSMDARPAAGLDSLAPHHHEAEDDEGGENDDADANDGSDDDDSDAPAGDIAGSEPQARGGRGGRRSGSEFQDDQAVRQRRRPRSYKIQEVIKRRQVILVQIVKEERGNKGAALTTYLSLAGRYTVLMPNTARGGGISRKITNPQDRKRLKAIAQELEVPEGMGLIIRTAGAARTKQEIKRDFEYLLRLWESVRDLTLQSTAPALVYEEGDLIKRSIRDLYNKDVEEVVVAGDAGHEEAAGFMRMLMPSHSKNVVAYKDPTPLFTKYGVERQLNAMFIPQVTLRSGGYIVINQTEALVAIDVNSGKSTREFSIEETALATNLEASDEIARQLKLRDLAGLIVIDFIDMEEKRNNRAVERRLKDALRFDRARIQLGRISHFGLMEMSRQRLRTGVVEGSTSQCAHCQGTGIIRSTESIALAVLRGLEDAITAGAHAPLIATTTPAVALYILNSKRAYVTDMEVRHGYAVTIVGSDRIQGANFTVERGVASALPVRRPERAAVNMDWGFEGEAEAEAAGEDEVPSFAGSNIETVGDPDDGDDRTQRDGRGGDGGGDGGQRDGRRGRRRGRGRGQRGDDNRGDRPRGDARPSRGQPPFANANNEGDAANNLAADAGSGHDETGEADEAQVQASGEGRDVRDDRPGRRRRRGRRGGRRGRERDGEAGPLEISTNGDEGVADDTRAAAAQNGFGPQPDVPAFAVDTPAFSSNTSAEMNAPRHRPERQRPERIWDVPSAAPFAGTASPSAIETKATASPVISEAAAPEAAPVRRRHEQDSTEARIERVVVRPDQAEGSGSAAVDEAAAAPQRKGWWQRKFGGE